jgi:hypothetical protein
MFVLLALLATLLDPDRMPCASDLIRFPPLEIAELRYQDALNARCVFERRARFAVPESAEQEWWSLAAYEADQLAETWFCLLAANRACDPTYHLRNLQLRLPPVAWHTGQMPPSIPYWRVLP